jgi:hypothetical protein
MGNRVQLPEIFSIWGFPFADSNVHAAMLTFAGVAQSRALNEQKEHPGRDEADSRIRCVASCGERYIPLQDLQLVGRASACSRITDYCSRHR